MKQSWANSGTMMKTWNCLSILFKQGRDYNASRVHRINLCVCWIFNKPLANNFRTLGTVTYRHKLSWIIVLLTQTIFQHLRIKTWQACNENTGCTLWSGKLQHLIIDFLPLVEDRQKSEESRSWNISYQEISLVSPRDEHIYLQVWVFLILFNV